MNLEPAPFTEIVITGNREWSDNFLDNDKEITQLYNDSKEKKGYGYSIKYQTIDKRKGGIQNIPVEFNFESELDFLKYLHKEKEVAEFRENCTLILSKFPELKDWIIKYPSKVISNSSKWNDLLKVCDYFKSRPAPNLYIRELPIEVHTKFIEKNKRIIKDLLNILIKDHIQSDETNFEKRFNLKYVESLVRFRILDKSISQQHFSGIDDLSIPISQFEKLKLPSIKNVLVVENKTNLLTIALTLPELEKTIVVFGSGYKVEILEKVEWFKQVKLFYWGDLDAQGFEILSQFRSYFTDVKSILMDKLTFGKYFKDYKGTLNKVSVPLNLKDEETELYNLLKENNWRLEQEKIPIEEFNELIAKGCFL